MGSNSDNSKLINSVFPKFAVLEEKGHASLRPTTS